LQNGGLHICSLVLAVALEKDSRGPRKVFAVVRSRPRFWIFRVLPNLGLCGDGCTVDGCTNSDSRSTIATSSRQTEGGGIK
jgi:hypothetical protein